VEGAKTPRGVQAVESEGIIMNSENRLRFFFSVSLQRILRAAVSLLIPLGLTSVLSDKMK
jgi:hypothetical protein